MSETSVLLAIIVFIASLRWIVFLYSSEIRFR